MHILILPSWYPRSRSDVSGSFFREQAHALHRRGVRVGVVAPDLVSIRDAYARRAYVFRLEGEDDGGIPTIRARGPNWFPRLAAAIRRLTYRRGLAAYNVYVERFGRPDVIHVQSMPDAGLVARTIESRWGIPYIVTEHTSTFATGRMPQHEREIWGDVASRARRRFAVSAPFARTLEQVLPPPSLVWDVLPNLVDRRFLDAPLTPADPSFFTFVNVALLEPHKGHAVLLRAFAKAFRGDRLVRLRLVGGGSEHKALVNLALGEGIASQVEFLGAQSREGVQQTVATGNVFVLSSYNETFGVAVVEALALGKPVVVTACGGPESFVQPADGWIAPVGDVDALASTLVTARRDASRLSSREIRDRCETRFGEAAVSGRLESVYRTIVDEG